SRSRSRPSRSSRGSDSMVRRLAHGEGGFGLLELLIAMIVMTVGIMAIVAGFSSGMLALRPANRTSTAGVVPHQQMETDRALPYPRTALKAPQVSAAASPYTSASAYSANLLTDTVLSGNTTAYDGSYCGTSATCQPVQASVTGPDGRAYRVDSFIVWYCAA